MMLERKNAAVVDWLSVSQNDRSQGYSASELGMPGSTKNESRITITQTISSIPWMIPRMPPMTSSAKVAFLNSSCLW